MADENGQATASTENGQKTEIEQSELMLINAVRELKDRLDFARKAGMQFSGDRDIWEELGYPDDINFEDYVSRYERQHIAGRIVDLPAEETWKNHPTVQAEDDDPNAEMFNDAFSELVDDVSLWQNLARVDRLSGIGEWGVLFLGFSDIENEEELIRSPINDDLRGVFERTDSTDQALFRSTSVELMFVNAFSQGDVQVDETFDDPSEPRFGQPRVYSIDMSGRIGADIDIADVEVHADRVIHVAEDALFDKVVGRPRLKRIYNLLMDMEKIVGPYAESFWKEVSPDWFFNIDPDKKFRATGSNNDITDFEDEAQRFIHKLQRYLVMQGVDPEKVSADVQSPTDGIDMLLSLISGETGIPKRKLIGSERGELASSQDERNWAAKIDDRRDWFAEPEILRPTIERLMEVGVLPAVPYEVNWPDLFTLTAKEKSEILLDRSRAAKNFDQAAMSGITIQPEEARVAQGYGADEPTPEELERFRQREDMDLEAMIQ